MGLTYSFTFSAAASVTAAELERFLTSVEADAKCLGFDPTLVFRATFATPEQREFARRIHVLLPVEDAKLQGVVLLGKDQAVNFDPEAGRCRVLPEEAVLLAVTDERQNETVIGFARYPKSSRTLTNAHRHACQLTIVAPAEHGSQCPPASTQSCGHIPTSHFVQQAETCPRWGIV